jgi:NADP-dependent aldehyde dehydrogenase
MHIETSSQELDQVLDRAAAAARPLATASPRERAAVIEAISTALEANADKLIELAHAESHLPLARLRGELARSTFQLRQLAQRAVDGGCFHAVIEEADDGFALGPRPDLRSVKIPLGPVLVFAASNFPFAFSVAGGDSASALAAGCPVILKAHPGHPKLSEKTASIVVASLPVELAGSFQLITGVDAGLHALMDPRIKAAAFTGSTPAGRALFDLAVGRRDPIPFYGELGSMNPVFVSPGTLGHDTAGLLKGFVNSFTLGVGQFCTKPGLLFVPKSHDVGEELVRSLSNVGPARLLGEWVADRFSTTADELLSNSKIHVLVDAGGDKIERGPLLLRTSLTELDGSYDTLDVECFGPASILVEYEDLHELVSAAAQLAPSLTATIHAVTGEEEWARRVVEVMQLRAGRVIVNDWPTGVAVSPAMHHGGPYPSSTSSLFSSVGGNAIERFLRPVSFQNLADNLLPPALQASNPLGIERRVNGKLERSTP